MVNEKLCVGKNSVNRYIRQEALKEVGVEGQKKICSAKVAIIGVGALGSVSAELLVRAGVGELLLVDKDRVSLENLHRQFLFCESDVSEFKSVVAQRVLKKINSGVSINVLNEFLSKENYLLLRDYDLILDCTDNMGSRLIINEFCALHNKTWIHAAVTGVIGNVLVVSDPLLFQKVIPVGGSSSCEEIGVLNSLTSLISSVQVSLALKLIVTGSAEKGLIRINPWDFEFKVFPVNIK